VDPVKVRVVVPAKLDWTAVIWTWYVTPTSESHVTIVLPLFSLGQLKFLAAARGAQLWRKRNKANSIPPSALCESLGVRSTQHNTPRRPTTALITY
jgi:hypothetical protein